MDINIASTKLLRCLLRGLFPTLLVLLTLVTGLAQAGNTIKFNGGNVAGCTRSGSSYSCAALPYVNYDDSIAISSGISVTVTSAVTIGYNQGLTMSGTAALTANGNLDISGINPAILSITGGSLTASGGTFSMGAQAQTITADISATNINLGTGSTTKVTGSLTATGTIALASHSTVVGPIVAASVTTNSPVVINGNVTVTNGFELASGSSMTGNLSAATVTLDPSSVTVTGNVAATTSLTIGSGNTIAGDVSAGNVVMQDSSATITGNASVTAITLGYADRVQKTITCKPPASGCSCVTNNSGYAMNGSAPGPVCAAAVTPPATPAVDHYVITQPGSGLTCQPQNVTVTACANQDCTAGYTGGVTGVLKPSGSFSIAAGSSSGSGTVQQTTSSVNNTPTQLAVSSSSPASTAATLCVNSASPNTTGAAACGMTFYDTGFFLAPPPTTAETATTITVSALKADSSQVCGAAFTKTSKAVKLSCAYTNPNNGPLNPRVSNNPATVQTSGSACSTSQQTVSLTFNSQGQASLGFIYADVGSITLTASYEGSANTNDNGLSMTGTGTAVVAPASFVLSPSGTSRAGAPLSLTVSAYNALSNVTANFGKESPPETVTIKKTLVSPIFSSPAANTNANPDLAGALPAFSSGISTNTNNSSGLSWPQVGVIQLTASLTNSQGYLGSNLSPTAAPANVTVIPHHLMTSLPSPALSVPMICAATDANCPGTPFVYSAQPFTMLVTAFNLGGGIVTNYDNSQGPNTTAARQVTVNAWDAATGTKNTAPAVPQSIASQSTSPPSSNTAAPSAFTLGVATVVPDLAFNTSPTVPTAILLRAVDTDNVTSVPTTGGSEQVLTVVSGQMSIANGYGSEVLPLPVNLQAQFYNAAKNWVSNRYDSGSLYNVSNLARSNCKGNFSATCTAAALPLLANPTMFSAGKASFRFQAPQKSGSVDITFGTTVPYLPSNSAREVFGLYKSGPVIYQRELY